jgi:hypothetical protein
VVKAAPNSEASEAGGEKKRAKTRLIMRDPIWRQGGARGELATSLSGWRRLLVSSLRFGHICVRGAVAFFGLIVLAQIY